MQLIEKRDEYVAKLREQLFDTEHEFCANIDWLGVEALACDAKNDYRQMWSIYHDFMNNVGAELFGSDVCVNSHSKHIEPVLDMLLNKGYSSKIIQVILGANNLFIKVKSEGYGYKAPRLREIASEYYAVIRRYEDGGVLTTEDRRIKWDFIECSERLFGAAYDIVEESGKVPAPPRQRSQHEVELQKQLEDTFDDLFGGLDHPVRHKIKRFFKKLFAKMKKKR